MPFIDRHLHRLDSRWWEDHVLVKWRSTCTIKVLMVADGATFDAGGGYKLSRVLEAIQHDLPSYVQIDVTTARHGSVSSHASANINNLRFDQHDLDQYDQIWLFAVNSGNAFQAGEATALWDFMQGGGGVFATGDHEALGEALCARIPRVRSMRRWYYPNAGPNNEPIAPARDVGAGRGETDSTTPTVGGSDFDGVPQTINPKMYTAPGLYVFSEISYPHPVLCGKSGMITKIADHMHEGRIEVPANLAMPISVDGTAVDEYPRRGGSRLAPEVIATSTINNNPSQGVFGVIGAYDGHQVDEIAGGVGRVVVDATWHHFWNMNVEQFASAHEAVKQAITNGLTPDPADVGPADAWEQIRDYFQNIALWLARRGTQACIRRRGLWLVANHLDVVMARKSHAGQLVPHFIDIGTKARDALQHLAPQCQRVRIIWEIRVFEEFLYPWRLPIPDPPPWKPQIPLLPGEMLQDLVLGAQIEAIAEATDGIDNADELSKVLDDEELDNRLADAGSRAIAELSERLGGDAQRLAGLVRSSGAD